MHIMIIITVLFVLSYVLCFLFCGFFSYYVGRAYGCGYNTRAYKPYVKKWEADKKNLSRVHYGFTLLILCHLLWIPYRALSVEHYGVPVVAIVVYLIACLLCLKTGKGHKEKGITPEIFFKDY